MTTARRSVTIALFGLLVLIVLFLPKTALAADAHARICDTGSSEIASQTISRRKVSSSARMETLSESILCDVAVANTFDGAYLDDSTYSCVWSDFELSDLRHPTLLTAFRSVSLSISSQTSSRVNVCVAAITRSQSGKLGVATLKLERYYNGRWIMVAGVSNRYSYRTNNYFFTLSQGNLVSGAYYRVTCTFSTTNGAITTRITRTTLSIRCR